jgi:hypothetical protein
VAVQEEAVLVAQQVVLGMMVHQVTIQFSALSHRQAVVLVLVVIVMVSMVVAVVQHQVIR